MNYNKIYNQLIEIRKSNLIDKGDLHHIIPKSWGGTDEPINLVRLLPREHFLAHLLLVKLSESEDHKRKMLYAVHRMIPKGLRTSRNYLNLRTLWLESQAKYMNESIGKNGETRRELTTRKSALTRKTTFIDGVSIEELRIKKISKGSIETIDWEHENGRTFVGTAIELSRVFRNERIGPSKLLENLGSPEYHRGWRSKSGGLEFNNREKQYTSIHIWTKKTGETFVGTSAELARKDKLHPNRLERFAKLNRRCNGWKAQILV